MVLMGTVGALPGTLPYTLTLSGTQLQNIAVSRVARLRSKPAWCAAVGGGSVGGVDRRSRDGPGSLIVNKEVSQLFQASEKRHRLLASGIRRGVIMECQGGGGHRRWGGKLSSRGCSSQTRFLGVLPLPVFQRPVHYGRDGDDNHRDEQRNTQVDSTQCARTDSSCPSLTSPRE